MESTDDDKEPAQTRSHDKGKRKSGRKRKRKESKKGKKPVSSDDDIKDNIQMNEIKPTSELSNSVNEPSKNAIPSMKEKQSATLPRESSKRSRSNSGKRSIKDLFRRSPGPRSKRSESADRHVNKDDDDIFHDASENFPTPEQSIDTMDYTKYNPTLQPRNRLRYMTVQDALKERHARRSPGRTLSPLERKILSERKDGRSSSLPDISAAESLENVDESQKRSKKPHRSKSADCFRRHNKFSRQEVVTDTKPEPEMSAPEASVSEAVVENEANASALETHFPNSESIEDNEHVVKQNETPVQNRLELDLHNHENSSAVGDRTSFTESESNSRESFNRFLHLRSTLPHFSNSSIARAQHYDSSPNEGNFNILDYISEHSRQEHGPQTEAGKPEEKGHRTYIRCPSYEEVMREKMALEKDKSQHHTLNNDSIKPATSSGSESATTENNKPIDSTIRTPDTTQKETNDTNNASAGTSKDTAVPDKIGTDGNNKQDNDKTESSKPSEETKPNVDENQSNVDTETNSPSERQSRLRQRGVFVSPRRFSGRSISIEEKLKATKDNANKTAPPNQSLPSDKENVSKDKTRENNPSHSRGITDMLSSKYSKYYSQLTSNIPNKDAKQITKPTFKYTRSFSPQTKPFEPISKLETVLSEVVKSESKCIQTDNGFKLAKVNLTSTAVNTDINLLYDFSNVTPFKQIPVIVESIQESKANDVENFTPPPADLPRKLSARSTISDKSAGSENDDNLVYKTPEASPVFSRKNCASTSGNNEDIQEIADDTNKEKESDTKKEQGKPKGKLSILSIVALKRRLARQRKLKNETVVSRQDSEVLPKKDEKDTNQAKNSNDESQEIKNKNIMFIENETNISLSKLTELDETDIIDDTNTDKDGLIFPKKHITFEKGDEPIASDDPLEDDVVLRDQQLQRRLSKRRESKMIQKRREVINCCKKFVAFLFSHIGLCSLMVAYSILGGIIFQALESPHEEKTKIKVASVRNDILTNIVELAIESKLEHKRDRNNLTKEVEVLLKRFQFEVYTATDLHGWNNEDDTTSSEKQWSFASALLFAITVMTTIGK